MSNRGKLRVPGRYERPAGMRGELGDQVTEAGIRAGFRAALVARSPARQPVDTVESSAATAERVELHEVAGGAIREAGKAAPTGRVIPIDIIRSGWNASGSRYYPAHVLERDVPRVYGKGTQMYIDHPSASEADDRPERSLTTLAAVFIDDPVAVREGDQVVMRTNARVFAPWQPFIAETWEHIGVSINGSGIGDHGQAEGRWGTVMESLTYGRSVDFVTIPGAGGRILGLLEAHRPAAEAAMAAVIREAASLGAWVESRIHLGFTGIADDAYGDGRLSREERITLSAAIGDALDAFVRKLEAAAPQLYQRTRWDAPGAATGTAEAAAERATAETAEDLRRALDRALAAAYSGKDRYAWYRDHDPDRGLVWFETSSPDGSALYQQPYVVDDAGVVTLTGARAEVQQTTVYRLVAGTATTEADPGDAGAATTTETTAGDPPAGSETGRVPDTTRETQMGEKSPEVEAREAAEARLTTITKERDDALGELARFRAGEQARPIVDELLAESDLPDAAKNRVRAEYRADTLPLIESTRGLDEGRLRTLVKASITAEAAYVASLAESSGAGRVAGMGAAPAAGGGMPAAFGTSRAANDQPDQSVTEALVKTYTDRGMTREAALAAATGRN